MILLFVFGQCTPPKRVNQFECIIFYCSSLFEDGLDLKLSPADGAAGSTSSFIYLLRNNTNNIAEMWKSRGEGFCPAMGHTCRLNIIIIIYQGVR